jgi:hypothetical protein
MPMMWQQGGYFPAPSFNIGARCFRKDMLPSLLVEVGIFYYHYLPMFIFQKMNGKYQT